MATYYHISPDGKKRRCKNPAKCRFKPAGSASPKLSVPESIGKEKTRQVRKLYSSGMSISFISSIDDLPKRDTSGKRSATAVDSKHSDIDFFTDDVKVDREAILAMGNPFKS